TAIASLSLRDALPISRVRRGNAGRGAGREFPDTGLGGRPAHYAGHRPGVPASQRAVAKAPLAAIGRRGGGSADPGLVDTCHAARSEEHTSELQSRENL